MSIEREGKVHTVYRSEKKGRFWFLHAAKSLEHLNVKPKR